MAFTQSTYSMQNLYDDLCARQDMDPGWDQAGYSVRPIISVGNRTFMEMCGGEGMFPWKWNEILLPVFVFNSWQQDYALVGTGGQMATNGGPSLTNLAWLQNGVAIDINQPNMPKPWSWVQTSRSQIASTASYVSNSAFVQPLCGANWFPNARLYYGTWGGPMTGTGSWGNNPQPNQQIFNPLGNGLSQPSNPICQIQDSAGNLLVLTQYGITGNTAPVAAANAAAGTEVPDGSCVWTVVDPQGQGIRIAPAPSQTGTVWQINLLGQAKPVKFSASTPLSQQSLYPLTDDYYQRFLTGAAAYCLDYSPNAKKRESGNKAQAAWVESLKAMRRQSDRERENFKIRPARSILGAGGNTNQNLGAFWPYGYPIS